MSNHHQPEHDYSPPPPPNTTEALDYWRKKLAEETQKQLLSQLQNESLNEDDQDIDPPGLNELAQKLDQIKFDFPSFEEPEDKTQLPLQPQIEHKQLSFDEQPSSTSGRTFLRSTTNKNIYSEESHSIDPDLIDRAKQLIQLKSITPESTTPDSLDSLAKQLTPADETPLFTQQFKPSPIEEAVELHFSPQSIDSSIYQDDISLTNQEKIPVLNATSRQSFSNQNKPAVTTTVKAQFKNQTSNPPSSGVPLYAFMLLLFYSSIVTLLCTHLFLESWHGNPQELENLPDVVPVINDGQTMYHLVPEGRKLPNGHLLSLAETRRFGNIVVTPVKVTHGPVEFEHYSTDSNKQKAPSAPAYKLWLELRNVSKDQSFAPLDRQLLLMKVSDHNYPDKQRSNIFLSSQTDRTNLENHLLVYNLPITGDWGFKYHPPEYNLKPGASAVIYIPSEPASITTTPTEMVWRIHLRKGYHPQTRHGVTTLVEVKFNTKNVEVEKSQNL